MGVTHIMDLREIVCFAVAAVSFTAYVFLSRCNHD
jgi:hypothetical protein